MDWDAFKLNWLVFVWKLLVAEVAPPGPVITIVIGFLGGVGGPDGQVLSSSLGAPAGGMLVVLLRQGMALRIETDGNNGVRFSGDYSYSARFDSKEYDLKNSTNDSVTLQLVDAHTVDAIYRRDNQITQKDRWIVSPDGDHMTLTTTGTLETGQQINETLLFRKQ